MSRKLLLVLSSLSGACVLPTTHETTTLVESHRSGPIAERGDARLGLTAAIASNSVRVRARWIRFCHTEVVNVYETTRSTTANLEVGSGGGGWGGGGGGGGEGLVLALVVIPAAITVSAVFTGLYMLVVRDKTSRSEKVTIEPVPCAHDAPDVAVDVTLPSGQHLEGVTGPQGFVELPIPETEPSGRVSARAGNAPVAAARYTAPALANPPAPAPTSAPEPEQPRNASAEVYAASRRCGKLREVDGIVKVTVVIGARGRVETLAVDRGVDDNLDGCIRTLLAASRFPASDAGTLAMSVKLGD